MTGSRRLFVGLPVTASLREQLSRVELRTQSEADAARLRAVLPANFHLTLVFLGAVDSVGEEQIGRAMRNAVSGQAQFSLSLQRCVVFPDARHPRVIAAIPERSNALLALQHRLAQQLACAGLVVDTSTSYRPHLTLARVQGRRPIAVSPLTDLGLSCAARRVVLFESRSERGTLRYVPRFHLSLQARPGQDDGTHTP